MKSISSILLTSTLAFLTIACEKEDKDAITMDQVNKGAETVTVQGVDYEVVDLGLPTGNLWATCNIGADSPEKSGSFFAWGEIKEKQDYEWATYAWANGDRLSINKYCTNPSFSFDESIIDKKTELELADDAANAILGSEWFIPTTSDFQELLTSRNCTAKWCKLNGIGGYLFTSVRKGHEGNSIFIPLSGMIDGKSTRFENTYGWYWCNSLRYDSLNKSYTTTEGSVLCLEHTQLENKTINSRQRSVGLPIRPVYRKNN